MLGRSGGPKSMVSDEPSEEGPPAVGLFCDLRNPTRWQRPAAERYRWTLDLVADAEQRGLGSVWCTEHHSFEDGYLPQPLVFAAALAARTRRVRVGTAVVLAPYRYPRHLAEEAAVVDLISGGRVELGIGAGYAPREFEAFGARRATRFDTTDAMVTALRDLLDGGHVTPGPVQRPMPMWLGYQGVRGARRAGRLGVGLLSLSRDSFEPYLQGLVEAGHSRDRARMAGLVDLLLADDPEAAADRVAAHYAYQRSTYQRARGGDEHRVPAQDPATIRATLRDHRAGAAFVCTVEEAAGVLAARLAGLPVRHIYFWLTVAGMPDDLAERHVELLCTQLRPALAAALGRPSAGPGTRRA